MYRILISLQSLQFLFDRSINRNFRCPRNEKFQGAPSHGTTISCLAVVKVRLRSASRRVARAAPGYYVPSVSCKRNQFCWIVLRVDRRAVPAIANRASCTHRTLSFSLVAQCQAPIAILSTTRLPWPYQRPTKIITYISVCIIVPGGVALSRGARCDTVRGQSTTFSSPHLSSSRDLLFLPGGRREFKTPTVYIVWAHGAGAGKIDGMRLCVMAVFLSVFVL